MEKKSKILVVGSVVLDTIFSKTFFGGTGANIAYGLGKLALFQKSSQKHFFIERALLKTSPMLFSLAGKDFKKDFGPHLKQNGVDVRVDIDKQGLTAEFHIDANERNKEIVSWQPNVYKKINKISLTKTIDEKELMKVSIAIFSPGTPESTYKHLREFRNFSPDAITIFDPGQEIKNFSKKILENCINLCDIFIVNEIEYAQTKKILEKDPRKIIKNKIIIETKGAKGSLIFQNNKITKVPAIRPKKVIDTTGAGDAYRAGLIFGLWNGFSLIKSCALGARLASKNIECVGCQKY